MLWCRPEKMAYGGGARGPSPGGAARAGRGAPGGMKKPGAGCAQAWADPCGRGRVARCSTPALLVLLAFDHAGDRALQFLDGTGQRLAHRGREVRRRQGLQPGEAGFQRAALVIGRVLLAAVLVGEVRGHARDAVLKAREGS